MPLMEYEVELKQIEWFKVTVRARSASEARQLATSDEYMDAWVSSGYLEIQDVAAFPGIVIEEEDETNAAE